ncbi:sigma 54-interacting transcriptional regulator [Desulfococcaceae bacterium HSG8]|nr:sigma 54-interacting transcriptional regulator [Desulfococcaceae bacterium HSG8]
MPTNKKLEQEIKELKKDLKKYRDLFENSPIGIFQSTVDGRLLNVNPAYAQVFGYKSPGDHIASVRNVAEDMYVRPEQRDGFVDMALEQNCLLNFEIPFRRKDGSTFIGNLHVRVARNHDGSVRYLEGFVEDITERKRIAEALRESEERYRTVFENTGTGTIIIENDMTISLANAEFEKLTGYTKAEIEGRMKWPLLIHEQDVERMKGYHTERRKKGGNAPGEYEAKIVDRHKNVRNVLIKSGIIPETSRSVSSVLDFTSRKKAEESLRERESQLSGIIEAFEGFIYICTPGFRIEFMNKSLMEHSGYKGTGGICHRIIYNSDKPCPWCPNERVFKGQTVKREFKNPGNSRWYYSVNSPILNMDNTVLKNQVMIIDINDRKLAEEALRESEEHLRKENIRLRSDIKDRYKFGEIIGKSPAMQKVYELIVKAATTDVNVIIYGESGTGKELVAKAVHDMSDRNGRAFVPVNCGAIPENLLESEFFGYKKGAFTGANTDKRGFLKLADRGTLFLDELGEIDTNMQVKLLRAIEGGGYTPIGGSKTEKPDVRIIAATNRNLHDLLRRGFIREDFFYRIHIIPIYLPPLRERREDIPLLLEHFLRAYGDDRKLPSLTGKMLESVRNYNWPGNVRELQNTVHRYVTLNTLDFTGKPLRNFPGTDYAEEKNSDHVLSLRDAMKNFEKNYIVKVLEHNRWHRTKAASMLGINRKTLFKKMKEFEIM